MKRARRNPAMYRSLRAATSIASIATRTPCPAGFAPDRIAANLARSRELLAVAWGSTVRTRERRLRPELLVGGERAPVQAGSRHSTPDPDPARTGSPRAAAAGARTRSAEVSGRRPANR